MSIMNNQYSNLLSTLYPVGSIYIGTQNSCPLATLIAGSQWQIVATQVVTNVNSGVAVYGNGKVLGLTNGAQNVGLTNAGIEFNPAPLAYGRNVANSGANTSGANRSSLWGITTDANNSGLSGSLSRTNLALNIWKRTA